MTLRLGKVEGGLIFTRNGKVDVEAEFAVFTAAGVFDVAVAGAEQEQVAGDLDVHLAVLDNLVELRLVPRQVFLVPLERLQSRIHTSAK